MILQQLAGVALQRHRGLCDLRPTVFFGTIRKSGLGGLRCQRLPYVAVEMFRSVMHSRPFHSLDYSVNKLVLFV